VVRGLEDLDCLIAKFLDIRFHPLSKGLSDIYINWDAVDE